MASDPLDYRPKASDLSERRRVNRIICLAILANFFVAVMYIGVAFELYFHSPRLSLAEFAWIPMLACDLKVMTDSIKLRRSGSIWRNRLYASWCLIALSYALLVLWIKLFGRN